MPVIIRDETANMLVITIDNSGNMYFGDGTPISAVTIAGREIIDIDGKIVHGMGSCTVTGVTGSVDCPITQNVFVTTLAGRVPSAQLNTHFPAPSYLFVLNDPTDPSQGGREQLQFAQEPAHVGVVTVGFFIVSNRGFADSQIVDPASPAFDPSVTHDPCGYQWI